MVWPSPVLLHSNSKHRKQKADNKKDPKLHVTQYPKRPQALRNLCSDTTLSRPEFTASRDGVQSVKRIVLAEKKQIKCMILPHNHSQTMKQPAENMTKDTIYVITLTVG